MFSSYIIICIFYITTLHHAIVCLYFLCHIICLCYWSQRSCSFSAPLCVWLSILRVSILLSTIIADHQIIIAVFYVENYDDQFFNVHVNMQGKAPSRKLLWRQTLGVKRYSMKHPSGLRKQTIQATGSYLFIPKQTDTEIENRINLDKPHTWLPAPPNLLQDAIANPAPAKTNDRQPTHIKQLFSQVFIEPILTSSKVPIGA